MEKNTTHALLHHDVTYVRLHDVKKGASTYVQYVSTHHKQQHLFPGLDINTKNALLFFNQTAKRNIGLWLLLVLHIYQKI